MRNSNALDFALLIQELVPLLEAYEHAWHGEDSQKRLELASAIPAGYVGSSYMQLVAAQQAVSCNEPRLLSDRREGKYVLSYKTPGGWVAITKDILTDVLGAGRDVKLAGLPAVAIGVLTLMCPHLVSLPETARQRT